MYKVRTFDSIFLFFFPFIFGSLAHFPFIVAVTSTYLCLSTVCIFFFSSRYPNGTVLSISEIYMSCYIDTHSTEGFLGKEEKAVEGRLWKTLGRLQKRKRTLKLINEPIQLTFFFFLFRKKNGFENLLYGRID